MDASSRHANRHALKTCTTEIYLHIVARIDDYIATHPKGCAAARAVFRSGQALFKYIQAGPKNRPRANSVGRSIDADIGKSFRE